MSARKKPPRAEHGPRPASAAKHEATPDPTSASERFADLLADARPLAGGPARVDRSTAEAARRAAKSRAPEAKRRAIGPTSAAGSSGERNDGSPGFRRPRPDVPHLAAAYGISDQQLARLQRGEPEPEERIDLHGLRVDDAKRVLAKRIESAVAQGLRCVVVVHGMGKRSPTGEAALRDAVPTWLTRGALGRVVLALAPAPGRLGGEGATMVLLRKG